MSPLERFNVRIQSAVGYRPTYTIAVTKEPLYGKGAGSGRLYIYIYIIIYYRLYQIKSIFIIHQYTKHKNDTDTMVYNKIK